MAECGQLAVDRFLLDRGGLLGELTQVCAAGFELANRVGLDLQTVEFGERAFLSGVEVWCELAELIEDVSNLGGLGDRPVGEWLLLGDQGGDLFEFDEVGPVGEDPLSPLVLHGHRGRQVLVHLGGVEFGSGDAVDELLLVGGRGGEELLEFGSTVDEFLWGRCGQRNHLGRRVVGEPEAVFEQAEHHVLPAVALDGIDGAWADPGLILVDVVEESVVGDAGDGVVPDGCCGRSGGSCTEPGGEPLGRVGLECSGCVVGGRVDGASVDGGVARSDAVLGQRGRPFGLSSEHRVRSLGQRCCGCWV